MQGLKSEQGAEPPHFNHWIWEGKGRVVTLFSGPAKRGCGRTTSDTGQCNSVLITINPSNCKSFGMAVSCNCNLNLCNNAPISKGRGHSVPVFGASYMYAHRNSNQILHDQTRGQEILRGRPHSMRRPKIFATLKLMRDLFAVVDLLFITYC